MAGDGEAHGRTAEHRLGAALVLLSALAWSTAGLFAKGIALEAWSILFWRGLFAAAFIALYLALRAPDGALGELRRLGWPGWLAASLGSAATIAFISAFKQTAIANVTVIYATVPFVAAAFGWLLLRERVAPATLLCSVLALAGVAWMASASLGTPNLRGDGLALLMTLLMALYLVAIRRFPGRPMVAAGGASSLQIALVAAGCADSLQATTAELAWLLLFGLLQAIGVVSLTEGTRRVPTAEAALLSALETPLAPLWAWLVLAEPTPGATLLGGGLVLAALLLHLRLQARR